MRLSSTYFKHAPSVALLCGIAIAACLSGCASKPADTQNTAANAPGVQTLHENRFLGVFSPYRIDVQQGNFISSETMTALKDGLKRSEGMTREQVRFLLGTPLITDVFHGDRWDYMFRLTHTNGETVTSHVTVNFKGNKLDSIDGTILPTEKEYISLIAGSATTK